MLLKFKMMTSPNTIFIFSKFWFSGFLRGWGVGGGGCKKGKNGPKWPKKFCITPYLWNCTSYDCGFWYTCVKWQYLQQFFFLFFIFSKSWFFRFFKVHQQIPPSSHVSEFLFCCPLFKCSFFHHQDYHAVLLSLFS